MKLIQLLGNVNAETAYIVNDYPYGWKRTKKRYWIETTKRGQRVVGQTLNPKTQLWNKPKKSTYSDLRVLYLNEENNHCENDGISAGASEERLNEFLTKFEFSTKRDLREIDIIRAYGRVHNHIKWTIRDNDDETPKQTLKEQNKLVNAVARHEYREIQKAKKGEK